jgi:ribose transport system substrate-binding protein
LRLSSGLVTPPAAKDDADASRQIRTLADQGIDAILVCCGTPGGLNDAIKYAHDKGALTVTLFGFSTSPYALNVATDMFHVGGYLVQRIAEDLNEKGNVLVVGGFLDAQASGALDRGVKARFADFPGVKAVGDLNVQGGSDAARTAVKAWLASHHDAVDGVIVRAGANAGIPELFTAAGRKPPLFTIGGDLGSLCYWRHHTGFAGDYYLQKAVVGWPPGDAVELAFDIAQRTLQGQGPKTQTILVDPLWLSYYDMMKAMPDACREDDDGWLYVGGESWGGPRALEAFFGKPADPKAYKP